MLIPASIEKVNQSQPAIDPVKQVAVTPAKPKNIETNPKSHLVTPKETLYSISRDYNVNVDDLKNLNEDLLKNGLKIGQTIKIPNNYGTPIVEVKETIPSSTVVKKPESTISVSKSDKTIYHVVEPKETKFGISKKYGLTVQELESMNPEIVSNLPIGFKLIVSGNGTKSAPVIQEAQKPKPVVKEIVTQETVTTEVVHKPVFNGFANYEVKPKETLYSLTQTFGLTQDELLILNPSLKDGVKTGMILKVPGKGSIKIISDSNATFSDLTQSIKKQDKKQLVLLLPFNASKIQSDTLKTIAVRLKKDAFLNMTLDFYSGALIAIDSAKTLGLNVDVAIFDSEESKLSSNVTAIVKNNNLQNADAVIGPFYQQYVETVAELLKDRNVAVISPLSKEVGKSFSNLYQAMPPSDFLKSAMFDFMMAKSGNIIVVSDPKKFSNKEFITKKYPVSKFVPFTETGALDVQYLKSILVKDKMNYVVLDTEKTGMILSTTNVLLNELSNFQIQIVIIEPNDTLDFEEISMKLEDLWPIL